MILKFKTILNLLFLVALQLSISATCHAAVSDLDDISIQVIGLDEIPDDALERIPLPTPDFGGLTDIREGIILNRPVTAGDVSGDLVNGPGAGAGGAAPVTDTTGGQ